jgi:type III secretion protein U
VALNEESGERTEEPTPRRLEEARRRGEVATSRDFTGAVALLAAFAVLALGAPAGLARLVAYWSRALAAAGHGEGGALAGLAVALGQAARLLSPPLAVAVLAAALTGGLQAGGLFTLHSLRVDPGRVVPSLRRVASGAALVELGKGLLKVLLVGALAWATLRQLAPALVRLPGAGAGRLVAALGRTAGTLGSRLVAAALALGVVDLAWRRHQHRRKLRMTRTEVRRERKENEGDPRHKAERQRLHRALAEQRMLADVRKADFVVVNPDHIAVALQYDRGGDAAPVVLARGERLLAEKIKEVAREAGVPIFRDVNLARALGTLEEGDEIPEALYQAVAEILRVVYEQGGEGDRTGIPSPPAAAAPAPGWRRA